MSKLRGSLALPVIAKYPESGAAIEDVGTPVDTHLDTRGVAAVTQVFSLRRRCRTTHAPEFHQHDLRPVRRSIHLPTGFMVRQFQPWFMPGLQELAYNGPFHGAPRLQGIRTPERRFHARARGEVGERRLAYSGFGISRRCGARTECL